MGSLKVNGKEREFVGIFPATITDLLADLKISDVTIIAEIDGKIIKRGDFSETGICPGQSIELVRFVGGG